MGPEAERMRRGYIAVEGKGEVRSVHNLIHRLCGDLGLSGIHWEEPRRYNGIHTRPTILKICDVVRSRRDVDALLILRDADDAADCPRIKGPEAADWARSERLSFPCAVVLFRREYETLFLPCLARMAGKTIRDDRGFERPGLSPGTGFSGDFERIRGVKEWLSSQFPSGRSYKPIQDQLPLTRLLDFDDLRQSGLPSFGTLERALRFLDGSRGTGGVYPPTAS
jgi:Domain of unknown function (DUF4276)